MRQQVFQVFCLSLLASCDESVGHGTKNLIQDQTTRTDQTPAEVSFDAFITGYSYWDNTPPGSANIALPVIHTEAGGVGTYLDPTTLAVGYTILNTRQTVDFPAGTIFYIPRLQKYAIVEDLCGDGERPQDGPCHTGHEGYPWLDIYVGGRDAPPEVSEQCMFKITKIQTVIMNPRPDYPVSVGSLTESDCPVF